MAGNSIGCQRSDGTMRAAAGETTEVARLPGAYLHFTAGGARMALWTNLSKNAPDNADRKHIITEFSRTRRVAVAVQWVRATCMNEDKCEVFTFRKPDKMCNLIARPGEK